MKTFSYSRVELTSGYLFEKQELNRKTTIEAVWDRFSDTGRIAAFNCDYKDGDDKKPHYFWDSDVAKWMEGAAYILKKHPDESLERRVDGLVEQIEKNQGDDGYFNIYFTVVEPENRWTERDKHELYCAGHLMEGAVAYAEATGKKKFLTCMEKYADYIYRVFVEEQSAAFHSPGHEEIELALMRMYRYTGKDKYMKLAAHFINTRGVTDTDDAPEERRRYDQAHLPVRQQTEAIGHAVRALYLYTGMASLARETKDTRLIDACKILWKDITARKMYVTGALGSTHKGEAFTNAYDLPSDTAYAETCAAIALMFFAHEMLMLENDAKYANTIERALYNGVLSGLSIDGKSFFYENPLEINLDERRGNPRSRYSITERVECFSCSCCPPNLNRLLASLGNYIYGMDGDTLYVNQFVSSRLDGGDVSCVQTTDYPRRGEIKILAKGAEKVAVRIPDWCENVSINRPYVMQNGYAVVENDGEEITVELEIKPRLVYADPRVFRTLGKVCVMRGPAVYCAEGVDNGSELHSFLLGDALKADEKDSGIFSLPTLEVSCEKLLPFSDSLYESHPPKTEAATLKLIPYNGFANRGESDMLIWLHTK